MQATLTFKSIVGKTKSKTRVNIGDEANSSDEMLSEELRQLENEEEEEDDDEDRRRGAWLFTWPCLCACGLFTLILLLMLSWITVDIFADNSHINKWRLDQDALRMRFVCSFSKTHPFHI